MQAILEDAHIAILRDSPELAAVNKETAVEDAAEQEVRKDVLGAATWSATDLNLSQDAKGEHLACLWCPVLPCVLCHAVPCRAISGHQFRMIYACLCDSLLLHQECCLRVF